MPEAVENYKSIHRAEIENAEAKLRMMQREKNPENDFSENPLHLSELQANNQYEKNGYVYRTDESGRTKHISGELKLEKGVRNRVIQQEVRELGVDGDEGGHIIGVQFDGPPDAYNLFPQNAELNKGKWSESAWANMEREWVEALKFGKKVDISVDMRYEGHSKRPAEIDVNYHISDGRKIEIIFRNQARNQIKYHSGIQLKE